MLVQMSVSLELQSVDVDLDVHYTTLDYLKKMNSQYGVLLSTSCHLKEINTRSLPVDSLS